MAICKFFQQGNCRFGSKCHNEHIDLKQLVKADIEASINGKQWPFSCYGPFKDKPCLPNFTEDQSFEEVRLMCYEAKRKNFFEQFHHQFNAAAIEANGKMTALLQFTPNIMNMIIAVYEFLTSPKGEVIKSNNPFDLSSAGCQPMLNKTNNMNTNIFGINANNKSNTSVAQGFSGNLFTANSNNQFNQVNTGNLFGSAAAFGQNKEPQLLQQQQQQQTIFGQPLKQNNSIFSAATINNNTVGRAPFSTYNQTTNLNGGNIFAQTHSLPQQQLQQQHQQSNSGTFGLFSQAAAAVTPGPQQQTLNQLNVFNPSNQNLFTQASNMQQQQNYSAFGQANQQQQLQQQVSVANQNLFSQHLQPNNSTIFGTQPSILEQQQHQLPQQQEIIPNAFSFQQNTQQQQPQLCQDNQTTVTTTLYSRLDELSADEIEAFKSDEFLPGAIPLNPPPKEFIN